MGQCASISSCLEVGLQLALSQVYNNDWGFILHTESLILLTPFHPKLYPLHMRTSGAIISHHD